jgi:NADH-dependent peroxiredoxin subunit F
MHDLIVIGAGPAGITASVYAARKKMDLCVISLDIGGQAAWSGDIENYTGYQFITGPDLAAKFEEHMRHYGIRVKENEAAITVEKRDDAFVVQTDKETLEARTVIVASGKRTRELGVAGEREFKNKGLTYCATCDAPLFAGKTVAVIGGGNSALDAVLQLMKIAQHVYLINVTSELACDAVMKEKALASDKVTVFNNARVTSILGEKFVNGIKLMKEGKEGTLPVQGVFVEIGLLPNSEFVKGVELNERKEIKVNPRNETNIPGLFAAGDVTDVPEKQIIIAAGEGSKAALRAFHYLSHHKF